MTEAQLDRASERLLAPFNPTSFSTETHRTADELAGHLDRALHRRGPVWPPTAPDSLLGQWPKPSSGPTMDLEHFVREVLAGSTCQHHPGFVGQQLSPPLPLTGSVGMLTALLNNSSAIFEGAPVQIALEHRVIEWMTTVVGYDADAGGALTSGGTLGALTALLAMRQQKVTGDAWTKGLAGQENYAILVSAESHYCNARACAILGFGQDAVIPVPTDDFYRTDAGVLERVFQDARARRLLPIALVANAGSTATGSHDDLKAAADFCKKHDLWLHVDAAHGGSALLSRRYRKALEGIERADSIVWDAHKMMLMPSLCTAVLVRNAAHLEAAFRQEAAYLLQPDNESSWTEPARYNFETTKPGGVVLPLYAGLVTLGVNYFGQYIDYVYDLARAFAHEVQRREGFELCVEPECNIVCFRRVTSSSSDDRQLELRRSINEGGRYFIMRTTLRGEVWLRVVLMNPATRLRDLLDLLDELEAGSVPSSTG